MNWVSLPGLSPFQTRQNTITHWKETAVVQTVDTGFVTSATPQWNRPCYMVVPDSTRCPHYARCSKHGGPIESLSSRNLVHLASLSEKSVRAEGFVAWHRLVSISTSIAMFG